jgi:FAD dependent monooxygenase
MTADLGMGANIAVESAVILCNIINRELKSNPNRHPSKSDIDAMFAEYQKKRFDRAKTWVDLSGKITRWNSYQSYFGRFFVGYISPLFNDVNIEKMALHFAKAPKLDYAPLRTVNEQTEGWQFAKKDEDEKKKKKKQVSTGWMSYVLLTSTVGIAVAYVMTAGLPTLF